MTLTQSLDISQRSTQSARSATAPGEGDVYNLGVTRSSHAWPANVMVGREAVTERAELDASIRIHKRVDDMLFETCETFSKIKDEKVCAIVCKMQGGNGAARISEKCESF